jgi:hypothetical protein
LLLIKWRRSRVEETHQLGIGANCNYNNADRCP